MSAVVEIVSSPLLVAPDPMSGEMKPLSAERKAALLAVLTSTGGNVTKAAEILGMTRQNVYRWASTDPAFAELFNDALEAGTDNLEERVYIRAMDTSDRLAEFLLKARRPDKYRENIKLDTEVSLNDRDVDRIAQSFITALTEAASRRVGPSGPDQQPAIDITPSLPE